MRVLFLSNEHQKSGTAYHYRLEQLSEILRQQGIHTGFLSLRDEPFGRPILLQPLNWVFVRRRVADWDFIHAGGHAAYSAAFFKQFSRAWVIHDVHGDGTSEAQLKRAAGGSWLSAHELLQARIADAVTYRYSDFFLVVSRPSLQKLITEKRIPASRIGLIRNGVDLEPLNPPSHAPASHFVVGYAGGFQPWQGIDNLVKAIELLPGNGIRLKIIGFTERHAALRGEISKRLGDRAELIGRVSQTELGSHLSSAQVLVIPRLPHPAVAVAFPTKFSQYLALGKPVIVSEVDETAALVREHRCGLVSSPSPPALAGAIRLAAGMTQEVLGQMGQNGRRLAEQELSWNEIGRKYVELLVRWSGRQ